MATLNSVQWQFLQYVTELIDFAKINNYMLTGGELLRSKEQQGIHIINGKSWTKNSDHLKALAIDLNIFVKDYNPPPTLNDWKWRLTYDNEECEKLMAFWESLDPRNYCGGRWKGKKRDLPHYGMKRNFPKPKAES